MPEPIEIWDYDPEWPQRFATIREAISSALGGVTVRIEHVGSTSVPGLSAKPIIDVDVVIARRDDLPEAIVRLAALGYVHKGDQGISGREAFSPPPGAIAHHLYVCASDNIHLARHLVFRDYLRSHPDVAQVYERLKRSLASQFRNNREAYTDGKGAFVEQVLRAAQPLSGDRRG